MKWAGNLSRMGERRGAYRVLVGKPRGKRPLRRPRFKWEDNNKMDLQKVGCAVTDWIELAQDRDRWRALVIIIIIIIIIIITTIGLSPGGSGYFTCTQI